MGGDFAGRRTPTSPPGWRYFGAMPKQNVEIVRRVFDAVSRGDPEAAMEVAADDFEMDWSNSIGPAKGIYRGLEEVRALQDSFLDAFDEVRWDPEEIIEVDQSRLIVVNHTRMRGRGSGVEVDAVGAQLWTIREGVARSVKLYQSKADALEAVGRGE
jgi:ketosteroid isomerase-like protein